MSSTALAFTTGIGFPTPGSCFSHGTTYIVDSMLGEGSYGKVVKCTRMDTLNTVAVKLIKCEPLYTELAKSEVSILEKLRKLDPDRCNFVKWHQFYGNESYACLEFEHLDKSLVDLMMERYGQPLRLADIRLIIRQVASALYYLKFMGIIHADLKLDNVMLVDHKYQPYRVKLIDFGMAQEVSAASPGSVLQTLYYRSPEILLGLPYSTAIDVWSLGLMAAALYSGAYLYVAESEYQMLRLIEGTQGKLPDHLLNNGLKTTVFYRRGTHSPTTWQLKTSEEYIPGSQKSTSGRRRRLMNSLDDFLKLRPITSTDSMDVLAEQSDVRMFVDMLKGMLQVDAEHRLTPRRVVQHPFIMMSHMSLHCAYASTSREKMDVCCRKTSRTETKPSHRMGSSSRSRIPSQKGTKPSETKAPDTSSSLPPSRFTRKDDGSNKAELDLKRRQRLEGPTSSRSNHRHKPFTGLEEPQDRHTSEQSSKRKTTDEPQEEREPKRKRRYLFLDVMGSSGQSQIPSQKRKHTEASETGTSPIKKSRKDK